MSVALNTTLDWTSEYLFGLVTIRSGQVDPRVPEYRDLPLIAPDHIEAGTGRLLKVQTAAEQGAISGKYIVEPGDVIYSKIRPYLRKAHLAEFKSLCSADMYPLRPRNGVDGRFVLNTLLGERFTAFAASTSMRSGIPKLNRIELAEYELTVPDSAEQRRIGTALADADDLISSFERLIAKKRAIKQGMMQELLTGRTRLPGYESSVWKESLWGDFAIDIRSGATPSRSNPIYFRGDIPWVTSSEMTRGPITSVPQRVSTRAVAAANLQIWPAGTFLMAITGLEAAGTRGNCGLLSFPATTNQSCMAVIPNPSEVSAEFLFYTYLLNGNDLAFRFVQGTKQQSYTLAIVKTLPLSHPVDVAEQHEIVRLLQDTDAEIDALKRRLGTTRAIKQGMMQELLTGRTRLPVEEVAP